MCCGANLIYPLLAQAEYGWKGQDPSFDNGYTYRHGDAIMLSGSYSRKGLSATLQAKRSQNMSFRTQRKRARKSPPPTLA